METVAVAVERPPGPLEALPDSQAHPDWHAYALAAGLIIILFCVYSLTNRTPIFPLDDAYITLHNATVLAGTPDVNYVGTPALDGSTSIVHTLLVGALCLVLPPLWALMVSQWLAILLYALGVVRLALVYGLSRLQTILLLSAALLAGNTPFHLLNGLETGLALAGFVWALALASQPKPSRALPPVCGVLPFLRPELALLSFLLLAQQSWRRWKDPAGRVAREVGIDVAMALAGAVPWLLLSVANTGALVPATINAKRFFFAEAFLPLPLKFVWVDSAMASFALDLGILTVCAAFAILVPAGRAALLFAVVFLAAFFDQFPGALLHNTQRYPALLLPLFLVGAGAGLAQKSGRVRIAAQVLLIAAVVQAAVMFPAHWRTYRDSQRITSEELASVASFCNLHLPPSSKLLVHDAGYIAYATKFPLVDLVGLKTPWAIGLHRRFTYPTGGRTRAIAIRDVAARSHPDYLVVLDYWDHIFGITSALRAGGWGLSPIRLAANAAKEEQLSQSWCYTVYKLTPPDSTP